MRWILIAVLMLAGCGSSPLNLLTGGGDKVAAVANVQAGQTNSQTIGTTRHATYKLEGVTAEEITQETLESGVRADRVEGDVTVRNGLPFWILWLSVPILAIMFVLYRLPPPETIWPNSWFFGARGSRSASSFERREPPALQPLAGDL